MIWISIVSNILKFLNKFIFIGSSINEEDMEDSSISLD